MLVVVKNLRTVGSLVRALRVTSITNPARPPPTSTWPSYLPYSESLMRNFNVEVTRWQGKYERGPTGTDHWQPRSWLQPTPHKTRACCLPGRARAGRPSRAGRRTNAPPRRTGCRLPRQVSRKSGPESIFFDFFSKFDHPVLCTRAVKAGPKAVQSFILSFSFLKAHWQLANAVRAGRLATGPSATGSGPSRDTSSSSEVSISNDGIHSDVAWPIIGNITAVDLEHCRRWLRLLNGGCPGPRNPRVKIYASAHTGLQVDSEARLRRRQLTPVLDRVSSFGKFIHAGACSPASFCAPCT
jgi:hypothetical protein